MFELDIPLFGLLRLKHLVSDFTGTLSVDGELIPVTREHMTKISEFLQLHILTADTFGMARSELHGINCELQILNGESHDIQKEEYLQKPGTDTVITLGNGNNDRGMLTRLLRSASPCALRRDVLQLLLEAADIVVTSITDALNILMKIVILNAFWWRFWRRLSNHNCFIMKNKDGGESGI